MHAKLEKWAIVSGSASPKQAGVKDHALLESAVYRPQQSVFGQEAYPTLFEKAAALLDYLAKNHPFYSGNKRTAYAASKSFLIINGYHLKLEREYAVHFMVGTVQGKYTIEVDYSCASRVLPIT